MSDLTDKQIELLYEMTEVHFEWFRIQDPEVTYEEVLKLNHIKMNSIIGGCEDCDEDMLNFIFESIVRDYKEMLDELN